MHTIYVIGGGLLLLGLFFVVSWFTGQPFARFLKPFLLAWLICAAVNLWVGVVDAGYSLAEELPIFAVVFAIPAVIAWLLAKHRG
ncbi:hypothetical protein L6J37_05115 [Photobacterium sp. WH77]|uniref:Uncharacterized protein n=1 Tax=Photobacterium arenosum TaxID=2774143 RepID=A0ABR9BHB2_9GAMM|nr:MULTISPECIES: hypothetical protein [Photobacterium]MBD8511953.1 hypothetical protein [Photobacterium arenosum]MBV7261341.1 hypothetical protein [Photobacterium sp. WH24]MCG2836240.1 hypothetical protein [Photobacterium sp. WH77]MCG2843623.1 hypothetical protein [Photobacterium sp. WH80]MDO6581050.1 hypothetical protein [Photobacterium sp. 2_MG-2023]